MGREVKTELSAAGICLLRMGMLTFTGELSIVLPRGFVPAHDALDVLSLVGLRAAALRAVGLRGGRGGVQLARQGGFLVWVTPRRGRGRHERHAAREAQLQRGRAVRRGQLRSGRAHVAGAVPDNGAGAVPDYGTGAVPGAGARAETDRAGGRAGRAR